MNERLVELLRAAHRILVFTGAGISTGSGIPDFRGPQGVWQTRRPVYYHDFLDSEDKRIEYWEYKLEAYPRFVEARPNATHLAIAELERMARVEALVTQNIDGLHQLAGSSEARIVELHGTNRWIECTVCERRSEPGPIFARFEAERRAPRCPCGGWLKPATISFGQRLRTEVLARGFDAAERADLVLALGSTLSVHPAASIPLAARERGVPYVVINRGATDHDDVCTLRIEGDVGEVLPPAVAALREEVP
jgi:NAD-dependent deacetylase